MDAIISGSRDISGPLLTATESIVVGFSHFLTLSPSEAVSHIISIG